MTLKHEKRNMIFAGLIIGVIASLLVLFGNPKNMGFCIACFLRDTAGGLGLHSAVHPTGDHRSGARQLYYGDQP